MLFRMVVGSKEKADEELKRLGVEPQVIVEGEEVEIYILQESAPSLEWHEVKVDWEEEWKKTSRVDLLPFQMHPGPGFGDLSHPTTQLMMEALEGEPLPDLVIDVGCGSGILTLAALYRGVKEVYAIDIDPEALLHTQKNLSLNGYFALTLFPEELPWMKRPALLLMNMIRSEQRAAWEGVKGRLLPGSRLITSGILKEERELYRAWAEQEGLSIVEERELSNWLLFFINY